MIIIMMGIITLIGITGIFNYGITKIQEKIKRNENQSTY